uniref:Uncharacterized protein n=1 Tax=Oryza glumipatula TaxID=40148 RepID=A0A0E0BMQ3_9ORYZ
MPSSLALPAAASSPSLPCYDGSRPEPRRAATVRPPMPLAGSGELIGGREKEPGETPAAAESSASSRLTARWLIPAEEIGRSGRMCRVAKQQRRCGNETNRGETGGGHRILLDMHFIYRIYIWLYTTGSL